MHNPFFIIFLYFFGYSISCFLYASLVNFFFSSLLNILKEIIENKEYNVLEEEKLKTILEHIELVISEKGENTGIKEMRKHISWYIKNTKDASRIRERINSIQNIDELKKCLIEYFTTL